MKILVANLGSTSFKYRLFDMAAGEKQLARGGIERIGSPESRCTVDIDGHRQERTVRVPDHAEAVRQCLAQLTDPMTGCLRDAKEVSAIGFKAVHGGRYSGVQRVTPELLEAMTEMSEVAPAHNPPYINAMRLLGEQLPEIPLVAAFETGFHQTIPDGNSYYAVPYEWAKTGLVRRWGFHGASHRYIATRTAELLGPGLRVISCHLGGSSSLCAIRDGKSVANSFGFSPQSGMPQNNRAGDFDPFALPFIMKRTGKSLDEVLTILNSKSGLAGLSGTSGDVRDVAEAAAAGNSRAKLALDVFASNVRHFLGAYLVELGGTDAIVFTGGIGENQAGFREMVCRDLDEFGIAIDPEANRRVQGETEIGAAGRRVRIWVIPTNEELVVARQAARLLSEG
ncbi:MAG: acetate/propionate family kinase [Planctomycetaceae bacterium]|nr:acetate/propionate family kinase [Planctomycetaceae bacterium]